MPTNTPEISSVPSAILSSGTFPLFLHALQAVFEEAGDAGEIIACLLEELERAAESGDADTRILWTEAATLVRKVLIERPGPIPLLEYSEIFDEKPGADWQILCTWCYLGASTDPRTVPSLAAAFHMTVAEFLYDETRQLPEVYEGVILPWFSAYWRRVFDSARFRFQYPRLIEQLLASALDSPPEERLQRLLGVVGFGLDVELPDAGQAWFTHVSVAADADEDETVGESTMEPEA